MILQHALYTILGLIYAATFTSFGQHALRYFDKEITFDMGYWPMWGLWLLIPALVCGVIEKFAGFATLREHESLFDTDPLTSIIETAAQGVPAFFRGVMYAAGIIVLNLILSSVTDMNIVRDVLDAVGLPYPEWPAE